MTETEYAAQEAARMLTNGSGCAIGIAIDYVQDRVGDRMEAADELVAALANWLEGLIPEVYATDGFHFDKSDGTDFCHYIKSGQEGTAQTIIGLRYESCKSLMRAYETENYQGVWASIIFHNPNGKSKVQDCLKWLKLALDTIVLVRGIYEDLNNA